MQFHNNNIIIMKLYPWQFQLYIIIICIRMYVPLAWIMDMHQLTLINISMVFHTMD